MILLLKNAREKKNRWGSRGGVMSKVLACGREISEFELQSHYYVHFQTNILEKVMNTIILPAMG